MVFILPFYQVEERKMASNSNVKHILLTGVPGIGKTTLIHQVCEHLEKSGQSYRGFYTAEKREGGGGGGRGGGGRRIGFDIIPVPSGPSSPLARLSDNNPQDRRPKVGQYVVDLPSIDRMASTQLKIGGVGVGRGAGSRVGAAIEAASVGVFATGVFFIVEIGKMELFSSTFKSLVSRLFDADGVRVIATIPVVPARGNPNPFIENIRARKDASLFTVTKDNRDTIFGDIVALL